MSARRVSVGLAGCFAVLMPLSVLVPRDVQQQAANAAPEAKPLAVGAAAAPLSAVYERQLFGTPAANADSALPGDAPALVGIIGRLGTDAIALVRTADGSTRALQIGESVEGWQLASLAIGAAFFTRGAERLRVPLPPG